MQIQEQLAALLPGVEITEEFVAKLTASIEAAVAQRVEEQTKEINEKAEKYAAEVKAQLDEVTEKANAYAEYVVEEMTKKVEDYCEYVVEQFVEQNRSKLVETEEYCRMASVLRNIREAFESNYFQLNAEPANKDLQAKLKESNQEFNKLFEQHRQLKRQIEEYSKYVDSENRKSVFESVTASLADTQKERLARLVEKAEFPTLDSYKIGLELMVEEFKPQAAQIVPASETSKESASTTKSGPAMIPEGTDRMKAYLERL
jgi:uncharacterized protein YdcH (DUF465 family)